MLYKRILPVLFLLFSLCECGREEYAGGNFRAGVSQSLRTEFTADAPGCFDVGGRQYGFCRELLDAYASEAGLLLEINAGTPFRGLCHNLENNHTDIGVVLTAEVDPGALSLELCPTRYVMLGRSGRAYPASLSAIVGGGTVRIVPGFQATKSYNNLLDSLAGAKLYVCSQQCYELAVEVACGESDFLICESSQAVMALEFVEGLDVVYSFEVESGLSLVFSKSNPSLFHDFKQWWESYMQSGAASELLSIYFNSSAGKGRRLNRDNRIADGISVWDDLIRKVGEREGVDWRLLSAIAYKESRFIHNVTSGRGARGLMQIMPVTARHFKVQEAELSDPEVNITLAAKLIKNIGQTLGFSPGTPTGDRLSITLAAYNCGIGTVSDARRLAKAQGWNPNSWTDVAQCLELMGDSGYKCDSVTFRNFRGSGETLAFVDGVKEKYETYRRRVN